MPDTFSQYGTLWIIGGIEHLRPPVLALFKLVLVDADQDAVPCFLHKPYPVFGIRGLSLRNSGKALVPYGIVPVPYQNHGEIGGPQVLSQRRGDSQVYILFHQAVDSYRAAVLSPVPRVDDDSCLFLEERSMKRHHSEGLCGL